jgi:hypothetical protein
MRKVYRMSFSTGAKRYVACLCLFTIMLLFTVSSTTFAAFQSADAPALGKTIITNDKAFAVDYPENYATLTAANLVAIGTSKAAIATIFQSKPTLTSGNAVFQIRYISADNPATSGLDTSNPNALLKSAIKRATQQQFNEITTFKSGAVDGWRVMLKEKTSASVVETFLVGKTPFLVTLLTEPSEINLYTSTLDAIVQSIRPNLPVALGQTFISSNQSLSIGYPSGWVVQPISVSEVIIGNTAKAITELNSLNSTGLTNGSMAVEFDYASPESISSGIDSNGDPVKLLKNTLANAPAMIKLSEVEAYTIGNFDTARVTVGISGADAVIYVFFIDKHIMVVAGATAPGKLAKFRPTLEAMISSMTLNLPNKK